MATTEGYGISLNLGGIEVSAKIFDPHKDNPFKTDLHKFMGDDYGRLPDHLKALAEDQEGTFKYRWSK